MKITKPLTLTEGYDAPSTEHVTPDLAILDTEDIWHVNSVDFRFTLPDRIVVRTLPEPVPLENHTSMVSLFSQGEVLTPQPLYHPDTLNHTFTYDVASCQMQSVRLFYDSSEWGELLPFQEREMIYEKPFAGQGDRAIQEDRQGDTAHPRILYGYGGIFAQGLPPEEIQQVYCELFEGIQRTEITLTSEAQWLERGVAPMSSGLFRGQQVLTDPQITYEQSLNLGAALTEGYVKFQLQDPASQEMVLYQSCEAKRPHNHPTYLDITFNKRGGIS